MTKQEAEIIKKAVVISGVKRDRYNNRQIEIYKDSFYEFIDAMTEKEE